MAEGKDNVASLMGTRRLADAVRQAKIAAAQRSDVVVDIREADRARLEILLDELQPLLDDLPPEDETFDFTLSGGTQPRLWVDGTANVVMARDRRTYRLVRETRLGRLTLAESSEPRAIAGAITDYVAARIVEREKAFALTDGLSQKPAEALGELRRADEPPLVQAKPASSSTEFVIALTWLMIGVVVGAGGLLVLGAVRGFTLN